jgi:hypothetical protein
MGNCPLRWRLGPSGVPTPAHGQGSHFFMLVNLRLP